MEAKELVFQFLQCAQQNRITMGKTKLIKMLYLAEVEYAQETGKRLTTLEWIYYFHGPYSFELEKILNGSDFLVREERKSKDGKKYTLFRLKKFTPQNVKNFADPVKENIFKKVLQNWGKKPLKDLVDYVYLNTDPMRNAVMRGDRLNFTCIIEQHRKKK
ncbi:MAG TPA: DUF4065 domain-containing protein [Bacteroidota bacterium]|nr:DUF4065 domain-containing protein [Bacteroidota bacterium]